MNSTADMTLKLTTTLKLTGKNILALHFREELTRVHQSKRLNAF